MNIHNTQHNRNLLSFSKEVALWGAEVFSILYLHSPSAKVSTDIRSGVWVLTFSVFEGGETYRLEYILNLEYLTACLSSEHQRTIHAQMTGKKMVDHLSAKREEKRKSQCNQLRSDPLPNAPAVYDWNFDKI